MLDLEDLKAKLAEYDPAAPKCPLRITHHRLVPDPYGDYDMTTHAPCCRPEGHEGECRNARQVIGWPGFETMAALVAEVERLRKHRESCVESLKKGYETGMAEERHQLVQFLRSCSEDYQELTIWIENREHWLREWEKE